MFIRIRDNKPYLSPLTLEEMRREIPSNVSIPPYPLTKDVSEFGFAVYEYADKPHYEPSSFKVVEEIAPTWSTNSEIGDFITQNWIVRDMSEEERTVVLETQWQIVRAERFNKLLFSDWTQIPNSPISEEKKQEWFDYRQELRDVTNQPDPFNIIWPTQPE